MDHTIALKRYLERHIEPELPPCPASKGRWRHVVVIPAYRESTHILQSLADSARTTQGILFIIVLNRPDSDANPQANQALRNALLALPQSEACANQENLFQLDLHSDVYLHDIEKIDGPLSTAEGVGLARKNGCDLALKWIAEGGIATDWICTSDADAQLPSDYFEQLKNVQENTAAAVFPFQHIAAEKTAETAATLLYELRLHHYVLGLEYAGSPYAYHTLGSCIAIRAENYAQVRGFPKRAAAEDFYLLNKLAKTGTIVRLTGQCIAIRCRESDRVPFGTGPAVREILQSNDPLAAPVFYDPQCFEALRSVLTIAPMLKESSETSLQLLLQNDGLALNLAEASSDALHNAGLPTALDHCRRQGKTEQQYMRQFHQWFDGFRTLKFIHALRDARWQQLPLETLQESVPALLPATTSSSQDVGELCDAIAHQWGWQRNTHILN